MEELKTPRRKEPDNIDEWSDEIEELLSEWCEVAMCYSYLHNISQRKYKKKISSFTNTYNYIIYFNRNC